MLGSFDMLAIPKLEQQQVLIRAARKKARLLFDTR